MQNWRFGRLKFLLAEKSRRLPKKNPKLVQSTEEKYRRKVKGAPKWSPLEQLFYAIYDFIRVQGGNIYTVVVAVAQAYNIYIGSSGRAYVRI